MDNTKSQKGNVVLGIVLTIAFAFVASIPWIVASYFGWFVGYLGLLIGIGALKGYEIGAGKIDKVGKITTVFAILLIIPIAEFLVFIIQGIVEIQAIPSIELIVAVLGSEGVIGAMLFDIALGYVFAFLSTMRLLKSK